MVSALIILFALVLALFEKQDLFKRPIKPAKKAIIALLVVTSIFSYLKSWQDDSAQVASRKTIDSLNVSSRLLTVQIDTLKKDNRVAQARYQDSLVSYHNYTTDILANYGYKVDSMTGQLKRIETPKNDLPTLIIPITPRINMVDGEFKMTIRFTSLDADAYITSNTAIVFPLDIDRQISISQKKVIQDLIANTVITKALGAEYSYGVKELELSDEAKTHIAVFLIRYRSKKGLNQPQLLRAVAIEKLPDGFKTNEVPERNLRDLTKIVTEQGYMK